MMPDEERDRILQMVAQGTITPAEASDLLAAIGGPPRQLTSRAPRNGVAVARNLTIQIVDGATTNVNIRIPLALARAAGKFIPRQAQSYLNGHQIDLEAIMESLQGNDGENTLLEVVDGDTNIRIAVE
jgi:hypothetical protein